MRHEDPISLHRIVVAIEEVLQRVFSNEGSLNSNPDTSGGEPATT